MVKNKLNSGSSLEKKKGKIILISVSTSPVDQGIRTISSVLKKQGYDVKLIFMKLSRDYFEVYTQEELAQLADICSGSLLIGINAFASTSKRAIQIIEYLKKLNIPIVWGGVHATICPEDCIKYVDIVCIGEGEGAIAELAKAIKNKKSINKIKNLWIKRDETIIKNPVRNLIEDLDSIPPPDYEIKDHYMLEKHRVRGFIKKDLKKYIQFLSGRGCPYGCDFCSNSKLNELYRGKCKKIVRFHSNDYIIKHIRYMKEEFPEEFNYADLADDVFLLRTLKEIKDFAKKYKKEINLPLRISTSPGATDDKKLGLLVDVGCTELSMGIQSSERVNREIYHRYSTDQMALDAAKILNKYKDRLAVTYDILTCNPYEKQEDLVNTIRLLQKLPKPYSLNICNLVFFPGSKIYERAIADGIIKTERDTAMYFDFADRTSHLLLRRTNLYLNLILNLMAGYVTEEKYGSLSSSRLDYLTTEERVQKYSKNPSSVLKFVYLLKFYDFTWSRLAKIYLSLPISLRKAYIRLRNRNDLHSKNLEKFK